VILLVLLYALTRRSCTSFAARARRAAHQDGRRGGKIASDIAPPKHVRPNMSRAARGADIRLSRTGSAQTGCLASSRQCRERSPQHGAGAGPDREKGYRERSCRSPVWSAGRCSALAQEIMRRRAAAGGGGTMTSSAKTATTRTTTTKPRGHLSDRADVGFRGIDFRLAQEPASPSQQKSPAIPGTSRADPAASSRAAARKPPGKKKTRWQNSSNLPQYAELPS